MMLQILNNRKKEIFFFILLLIIFYRSPHILLYGRFVVEEGNLFFANAYKYGFVYSFFFVEFKAGYFNIWANLSGIIANIFTLKLAPLVSNYLSLIPKLLIFYFILYKDLYLTDKFHYKIVLCLLILLSPLNVPEIWLNSLNSQIFFCILSFLVLFSKNDKKNINHFNLLIILISGFTGVYTCVLTPVFLFKYLKFKTSQDMYNLIILIFCSIIQFILVVFSKLSGALYEGKLHAVDINLIYNYVYNVPIKAFLGRNLTQFFFNSLNFNIKSVFIFFCILGLFILTYLIYYFKKNPNIFNSNKFIINSLFYAFISTSLLTLTGATYEYVGGRYAALPSFYLVTLVLFLAIIINELNLKIFFHLILLISILSGAYEFKHNNKYKKYLICINCPNWSSEVEKFNKNSNYIMKIWPYPERIMRLN